MLRSIAAAAVLALAAVPAAAEEHVVRMLNKGPDGERMVYEPAVIMAQPGDTVRFVPEDKGHNAATVKGGLPEGAESVRGRMNREVVYEVGETGLHLIKCTPHWGLGMIALIVSGDDFSNQEALEEIRMPRRTQQRFEEYLEQAKSQAAG